jgi:hypothetical protein
MKNIHFPIMLALALLVMYVIVSQFYPNPTLLTIIYAGSPFFIAWTVYEVLRDGIPSRRDFDGYKLKSRRYLN